MSNIEKKIQSIENVRSSNNRNWMDILRLAIKYSPREEILEVLKGIDVCDEAIKKRFKDIIEALELENGDGKQS